MFEMKTLGVGNFDQYTSKGYYQGMPKRYMLTMEISQNVWHPLFYAQDEMNIYQFSNPI
jgi:hypothetical protein